MYTVQVEGNGSRTFKTITQAMAYGQSYVYLSPKHKIMVFDDLQDDLQAQWSYGFRSVTITPEHTK